MVQEILPPANQDLLDPISMNEAEAVENDGEKPVQLAQAFFGKTASKAVGPMSPSGKDILRKANELVLEKRQKQEGVEEAIEGAVKKEGTEDNIREVIRPKKRFEIVEDDFHIDVVDNGHETPQTLKRFPKGSNKEAEAFLKERRNLRPDFEEAPKEKPAPTPASLFRTTTINTREPNPIPAIRENDIKIYDDALHIENENMNEFMQDIRDGQEGERLLPKDGRIGTIRAQGFRTVNGQRVVDPSNVKIEDDGGIYNTTQKIFDKTREALSKMAPDEVLKVSQKSVRDMADIFGRSEKKLVKMFTNGQIKFDIKKPGELAAIMLAGKEMVINEIRVLDDLVLKAFEREGGPTARDQAEFMQQYSFSSTLMRSFTGAQADVARAMNAMKIPVNFRSKLDQRDIVELLENFGGSKNIIDIMGKYRDLPTVEKKAQMVDDVSFAKKLGDALFEGFLSLILSNPWTGTKNINGIAQQLVVYSSESKIAQTLAGARRPDIDPERPQNFFLTDDSGKGKRLRDEPIVDKGVDLSNEANAGVFALFAHNLEAWSVGIEKFKTRDELYGTSKMEVGKRTYMDALSAEAFEIKGWKGTAFDVIANTLLVGRFGPRQLAGGDAVGKVLGRYQYLYEQGWSRGIEAGKSGDELSDFIADMVHNPPPDIEASAQQHAREITLTQRMGDQGRSWQSALRGDLVRFVVPFFKIANNSLVWVGERTPLAGVFAKRNRDDWRAGGVRRKQVIARQALGLSAFAAMYTLVKTGTCTGQISNNKKIRDIAAMNGKKPFSCRIGDKYVRYDHYEPIATLLQVVSSTVEIWDHPESSEQTRLETGVESVAAIGSALANKSWMQGLGAMIKAVADPSTYSGDWLKNYWRSLVPSMVGQAESWIDDAGSYKRNNLDVIYERLPGLSSTLKPERDLFGNVVHHNRVYTPAKDNPTVEELSRLHVAIDLPNEDLIIKGENTSSRGTYSMEIPTVVKLTEDERDYYFEESGKLLEKKLQKLFATPAYKKLRQYSMREPENDSDRLALKYTNDKLISMVRKEVTASRDETTQQLRYRSKFRNDLRSRIENRKNLERIQERDYQRKLNQ